MSEKTDDAEFEELRRKAESLKPKYPEVTFKAFFEEIPPETYVYLVDLKLAASDSRYLEVPEILLFCDGAICNGLRSFRCSQNIYAQQVGWQYKFLEFNCRNCGTRLARFAVTFHLPSATTATSVPKITGFKFGQVPAFGSQTPARLITLIGPDREIFLQGRRAENRGLGIGAFAYYRRVVENQKNRIIEQIAKVAKLLGCTPETSALFTAAIRETQFSKSVAMVKDVIPQTLMISGQNPLILLHSALSKGLHDAEMTDEHCLKLAQSIRTILGELAERASEALKNTKEIQSALSVLMSVSSNTGTAGLQTDTDAAQEGVSPVTERVPDFPMEHSAETAPSTTSSSEPVSPLY